MEVIKMMELFVILHGLNQKLLSVRGAKFRLPVAKNDKLTYFKVVVLF